MKFFSSFCISFAGPFIGAASLEKNPKMLVLSFEANSLAFLNCTFFKFYLTVWSSPGMITDLRLIWRVRGSLVELSVAKLSKKETYIVIRCHDFPWAIQISWPFGDVISDQPLPCHQSIIGNSTENICTFYHDVH